ncbi:MAG: Obg family GTPase CgtA, partial [Solirubrobacterales bacterium]
MLYDKARIYVEGGRGGDGVVSFRREAHVPRGGPDGGDGGRGGDVMLICDAGRRDLASLGRSKHFRADRGRHGQGKRRHGERGGEREVAVPPGTVVTMIDGSSAELLGDGQRLVVARGGGGGHGNKRFASSTRQSPRFAERGLEGESGWIELRLKLLADVGLVGLPNAGKSSLLARLTRAAPKVADYPFTTLEPVLGTLELDDRKITIADVPGLIEGAASGVGLGHEFLAHVERCRLLVHLVEISPPGDPEQGRGLGAYETVRSELAAYGAGLGRLPEILVLSKADLVPAEEADERAEEWSSRLHGEA